MKRLIIIATILLCLLSNESLIAQVEICWNRIDDDLDGQIDCADTDCETYNFCFECDERFYQVINNRYLATLDIENQWYKDIFVLNGINLINGAAMNPIDGHVYASAVSNGANILVIVGNDGSLGNLGLVLPGDDVFFMATVDDTGNMYLSNTQSNILKINLNLPVLVWEDTGIPYPGGTDMAYHYDDGMLYGIGNDNKLIKTNLNTGEVIYSDLIGPINNDDGYYGAVWANKGGQLFAANGTSGKIYSIDIATNIATEVMNATANLTSNDGFNCGRAAAPFETDCGNGIDDDGDGLIDCADPDCANSNVCLIEICNNGVDDDGDGFIDCADVECQEITSCIEICDNRIDDNGDGLIDEEDPQCNTTGGEAGGLESNRRLGAAIAQRNFVKKKLDIGHRNYPIFQESEINTMARSKFDMSIFIPTNALSETVAQVTSPDDLIHITNATEVFSTDYVQGERRLATILILKTEDETYEHTKYICDRLDGAQIRDISTMFYNDAQLITVEMKQADGNIEYACSFAVYLDEKGSHIENHWLRENYTRRAEMYNFQIWANSMSTLTALINATIDRIDQYQEIKTIQTTRPPRVFISHGKMVNGKLNLYLINKNQSQKIKVEGKQTATELSETEDTYEQYNLTKSYRDKIIIDMHGAYDIGCRIYTEHGAMDDLFFADGPWGTEIDEQINDLTNYEISASDNDDIEGYTLDRDVNIKANLTTSMNIFRGLGPKFRPVNLDEFNNFTFTAKGNTSINVVMIKEEITLWEDQPRYSIQLSEELKKYTIAKNQFNSSNGFNWKDIKMVVFELMNTSGTVKEVEVYLSNLNFNNGEIPLIAPDVNAGEMIVHPNPFYHNTNYIINSNIATTYRMKLTDNTGKLILSEQGNLIAGINNYTFNRQNSMTPGIYFLQVIDGAGKIYTKKIILNTP